MITTRRTRGNALAELVILLPIYVLVILGLLYVGDLTGIRLALQPGAEQAAALPTTTEAELEQQSFVPYNPAGNLTITRDSNALSPAPGLVPELIEQMVTPDSKPEASVSWRLVNGKLVPILHTGSDRQSAELDPVHMTDDEPELIEDTLLGEGRGDAFAGFAAQVTAVLDYEYDPGYVRVGPVDLESQTPGARHTSLVRGKMQRELDPHASNGLSTDKLIRRMPDAASFPGFRVYDETLWLPDLQEPVPVPPIP